MSRRGLARVAMSASSRVAAWEARGDDIKTGEGVGLRDQIVAAMAILDDALSGAGIAGIHDDTSWRFDPIPESLLPLAVLHQERFHGDDIVLIDVAGFDLMDVHFV